MILSKFPTCARKSAATNTSDRKDYVPDKADLLPWLLGDFIWQKVQHHRRPAGVAAPASAKQQRAKDLRHSVVNRRSLKNTGEQIVPKAFDLHILSANQTKVDQHIQTDQKLDNTTGVPVFFYEQEHAQRNSATDVAEIKKIKEVILRQP